MATEGAVSVDYVRSAHGILRICEFVVSICAIISIESGYWCPYTGMFGFYQTVCISATIFVFIFFMFFLFRLDQSIGVYVNLTLTQLITDSIYSLFYFIASIIAFVLVGNCSVYYGHGGRVAAAIFGIMCTGLFFASAFLEYRAVKGQQADPGAGTANTQPKPTPS